MNTSVGASRTPMLGGIFSYRSLFWPLAMICLGTVALLWNNGTIAPQTMMSVLRLWPLLLIFAGLDVLVGRRSVLLNGGLGLGLIALVVLAMAAGPSLGLTSGLHTYHYSAPVAGAQSAQVNLDLKDDHVIVAPFGDLRHLATVDLTGVGEPRFAATGTTEKTITFSQAQQSGNTDWIAQIVGKATIRLNQSVPMAVEVSNGSGLSDLDLSTLKLTGLNVNSGSGQVNLQVPAGPMRYGVALNSGSGIATLRVAHDAALDLTVNSGSGRFSLSLGDRTDVTAQINAGSGAVVIDVPDNAPLQVQVQSDTAAVWLPSGLHRLPTTLTGQHSGLWQSSKFVGAAHKIVLDVQLGSGTLRVR